jgi:NAD(P)-dependent dehydrogenase (short-subunit alcohol dehydrogenase family)
MPAEGDMKLENAVCIVTGSAVGIGAACAVQLAARGARVVVNYTKSEADARATAAACEGQGPEALVCRANVADDSDCRRLAEAALAKWGRIDALVNNAGITKFAPDHSQLDALQASDFHGIYDVNVVGPYQMIRAVAPAMKAQGKGAIVNVSSIAGIMGIGSSVAYAASKGALNVMTLSLARALAPEIRVNAVCPGFVETRWLKEGLGEPLYTVAKTSYQAAAPLQSVLVPEDVASAVVWLIEGADTVTGELIILDGGVHLGRSPARAR